MRWGNTLNVKPALRDSAAAFAAALFASGCTTTIVSPNLDGLGAARLNSEKAVFAIKSPDLIRCDELACYYGPGSVAKIGGSQR